MTVNPIVTPSSPTSGPDRTAVSLRYDSLLIGLADRVSSRAVGLHLPARTRLPGSPQDRLWLGMLASEHQVAADQASGRLRTDRVIPAAQGFSFRIAQLPATIDFDVTAAFYLALTPTLDEQRTSVAVPENDDDSGTAAAAGPASPAGGGGNNSGHKIAQVWTKCVIDTVRVPFAVPDRAGSYLAGRQEITAALAAAAAVPAGAELFRPRRAGGRPAATLPREADMSDETAWAAYCAGNLTDLDDVTAPTFAAHIQVDITRVDAGWEIFAALVNSSPTADSQTVAGTRAYERSYLDTLLYEASLTAHVNDELIAYELEQVAQSYRYDRTVDAFGHAGAVEVTATPDGGVTLATLFAAQQPTFRVDVRTEFTAADGTSWPVDTTFVRLIDDPVGALEDLVAAHRAWVAQEWSQANLGALAAERGWDGAAIASAREDAVTAAAEADWVAAGVELIRTDKAVRDAFVAANRTVAAAAVAADGTVAYDAWYPFQIAWIVGCLPGMADPDAHPDVNIVWFATGGGKSEAYLGLMLATLFYGRFTGVRSGTQVWARFPLRLLALQQTERFARMIFHAELLRRDLVAAGALAAGDSFGIGYFVGGGNTPNELHDPRSPFFDGRDPNAPETAAGCRVLDTCPLCGQTPAVEFDSASWTMRHICRTAGCRMRGQLPVWGVDHDIYRNAPSVLVGTVDKLAQLGQQRQFQILLGHALLRCQVHGYSSSDRCVIFGCTATREPVGEHMGALRLEIADELHLLEESLGALDGMYETLLQSIAAKYGNAPMQIVGATATIEGFQSQVKHLYQRAARRFPVNGPNVGQTFWSTTSDVIPLRRFLGVQPRRITMVTAAREIALTHGGWLADLLADPAAVLAECGLDPDDQDNLDAAAQAAGDLYEVLLTYGLRTQDLNSFIQDNAVRDLLERERNLALITGDQQPADIRDAVARLVDPPDDPGERVRLIAATKAIGHGFDVARLGVMTVMGTPTSAAEIIQASARVGRRWPGLVVYVVNPTRDRDVSVYRYFSSWISFLDRLVNKVPVNRDSLPILNRVLSGGLMAYLLQVYDRGWFTGGPRRDSLGKSPAFRAAVTDGYLDPAAVAADLKDAFGIDPAAVLFERHRASVEDWVARTMTAVTVSAQAGTSTRDLLSPAVPRSLRDIEEPITVYCDLP